MPLAIRDYHSSNQNTRYFYTEEHCPQCKISCLTHHNARIFSLKESHVSCSNTHKKSTANEYNEKREELLRMNPDMDTSEIIQAFIEKPTYDSSNRIPSKATPELLEAVEKCLQLNRDKRLILLYRADIHSTIT